MNATLASHDIHRLLNAEHDDPFGVLGLHRVDGLWVVRAFRPDAKELAIVDRNNPKRQFPANRIANEGLFEAQLTDVTEAFDYLLQITTWSGESFQISDPYSYGPILGDLDMYLYREGNHFEIYEKLGAHLTEINGHAGATFAVWAPNAQRVSIVGDFNGWDGRSHPMRKRLESGIWEIFIPGIVEGTHYKLELRNCFGQVVLKSDPLAFFGQHGIQTASLVFNLERFKWSDDQWIETRKAKQWHKEPVSIYEVHLGSWARVPEEGNRFLSYIELADRLIPYVKDLGYTHIELMPVAEHPFDGSWGYQVTGYYAPTSRFGNPDEFRHFVDRCHENGIGVIVDWVPGHFPKDAHGLAQFDGTHLYEHSDPRQGEHRDWGTLIFNYGRNEVRNFLVGNGLFWLDKYHIDGLRVDAVASMLYLDYSRKPGEWVPNVHGGRENLDAIEFMKRFNEVCYARFPGIMTIAEESTAWPGVSRPVYLGGLGFGLKWNMGWMHDFLLYMSREPIHRRFHQGEVTFSMIYAFHEHFVLVLSHDEVVHGKGSLVNKMPGDPWQKFANLRMFYAWMYAHPGKKLLFMGGEIGQWKEWNHDESVDWHLLQYPLHDGLRRLVQHLNFLYQSEPAFWENDDSYLGFEWIDFHDADNSVLTFMRKAESGPPILFVVNATPVPRHAYRVGAPGEGWYEEILNTDAGVYGGGNIGNYGGMHAEAISWQGRSHSLCLTLPPLTTIGFKKHEHR
ncbi:MAG: 1,4-alpha-glucan branching protein GlgB [Verrucomicrobia bacterium]|nr:1,4-alpha-glucan branching protein GlgB [Verrucomicrobiota bacterium]